jgi:hypothetical protein
MLGTPNFGAIRTGQQYVAAFMLMQATRSLHAVFQRSQGVLDLTRVGSIMSTVLNGPPPTDSHAADVEYVTIPGRYFHQDRKVFDRHNWAIRSLTRINRWAILHSVLSVWNVYSPVLKIPFDLPHDGIVEEKRCSLSPPAGQAGAFISEKLDAILRPESYPRPTYAHLPHRRCNELTHEMIQHDDEIVRLVVDLVAAGSIGAWHKSLGDTEQKKLFPEMFIPGLEPPGPVQKKHPPRCRGCRGTGDCKRCKGQGSLPSEGAGPSVPCNRCGGTGVCPGCGGKGLLV